MNPRVAQWGGAILWLLMSAGVAFIVVDRQVTLETARELAASGIQTRATVTGMRLTGKRGRSHNLSYRFRVAEREFGGTDRRIPSEKYDELDVGAEIAVRFDPANPHRHVTGPELEELERWSDRIGYSLLSLAFLTACVSRLRDPKWKKTKPSAAKATQKPRRSRARR